MNNETWRQVRDTHYEVSSLGRIRSRDFISPHRNRWGTITYRKRKGRVLSFSNSINGSGYYSCQLGGKFKAHPHRLVAEAFCERPPGAKAVNHKNGIRTDNRAENLEWVSYRQNTIHGRIQNGSIGKKFTHDQVIEIIRRVHFGTRVKDMANELGTSRQFISRLLSGRQWPSKDYPEIADARKRYPYVSPKHGTKWILG